MAETYNITYEGAPVGSAQMEKHGLYYVFTCRCKLPQEGLYRIHVTVADRREDLGICVPMDGAFGMDKKISAKRLGEGTPAFELVVKDWKPKEIVPEPLPQEEAAAEERTVDEPMRPQEETIPREPDETPLQPEPAEDRFIPVSEEEPFAYLDKLEAARMEVRNDTPGIVIQDTEGL